MKKKFTLVFLLTLLSSCSLTQASIELNSSKLSSSSIESSHEASTSSSSSILVEDSLTYLDLFNIDNKIRIDIHIDNSELQKLNNDFNKYQSQGLKSPIYRLANKVDISITKNDKVYNFSYDDVGIRMKGNTSRKSFIDSNNNIYNTIHLKLSFEETFSNPNYYTSSEIKQWTSSEKVLRENRDFLGLSKLDLRFNKIQDQSHIKEYYALEMFRENGILSQHTNFGDIKIHQNNKVVNYGLFLITEPLNKSFIKRSLKNEKIINMPSWDLEKRGTYGVSNSSYGQLYKASYGLGSTIAAPSMTDSSDYLFGVEPEDASYIPPYELKTNKDSNDHHLIKEMINTLNNGTLEDIKKVVDLDYFITFEAISYLLGNPDDLRNNYNNYAMYFRRTDGKMVLIPIDLDRVLGVSREFDPSGEAMSNISPTEMKAIGANEYQRNQLYNKTIINNEEYKTLFLNKVKELSESKWFSETYFNSIYQKVKNNYQSVKSDLQNIPWSLDEKHSSNSNMSFKDYVSKKKNTINKTLNPDIGENIISNCHNFYLTGTMDNWNKTTKEYYFSKIDDTTYRYTYAMNTDYLECKIYTTDEGGKWLRAENGFALHEGGGNIIFRFNNVNPNRKIIFTVKTNTGVLTYTIEE